MKKGIKNLIICGTAIAIAMSTGYAVKKNYDEKHKNDKGIKFEPKEERVLDDIRIAQAINYNDGSITFLMESDTYDFNNDEYVIENPEEVDYIEYFDEFGNKTVVDYPTPEPQKTKTR